MIDKWAPVRWGRGTKIVKMDYTIALQTHLCQNHQC